MKTKFFTLLSLSVLMLVMVMSFGSAVNLNGIEEISCPENVAHDAGSFEIIFKLTNKGIAGDLYWDLSEFTSLQSGLDFSFDDFDIADGSSIEVTETITATISFDKHQTGIISGTINVGNTVDEMDEYLDFSVEITPSPLLSIELTKELTKTHDGEINVTNTGNVNLESITWEIVSGSDDFSIEFDNPSFNLDAGEFILVKVSSEDVDDLDFSDDNVIILKAISLEANSSELALEVPVLFCEDCGNEGGLNIKDVDFSVEEGFGDNSDYWYPFDEIEVEVEIENNGAWEIEDIEIQVCLLDVKEGTCVMDEDDMSIDTKKFDLEEKGEDDNKIVLITFQVDANDLEGGNEDYRFYIKAIGTIDDKDAPEEIDGEKTCDSTFEEIEIRTDENFVILNDFEFVELVQCGTEVQIFVDVWNIEDNKIDEEDIYIRVYNNDLKIDKIINVEDISAFDSEKLEIIINIPEEVSEGWHKIEFSVYDDEDCSSNDIYENSEEDKAIYEVYIKVEGNCISEPKVTISADLESEAKAGKELIVRATIINTGTETSTFEISLTDYINWASLGSIVPESITLDAGESEDVLITLNVNSDVSGNQNFDIVVTEGTKASSQQIAVMIEQSGFGGLSKITGGLISESNWPVWTIGAVNIILVFIIILVAIKVAKK